MKVASFKTILFYLILRIASSNGAVMSVEVRLRPCLQDYASVVSSSFFGISSWSVTQELVGSFSWDNLPSSSIEPVHHEKEGGGGVSPECGPVEDIYEPWKSPSDKWNPCEPEDWPEEHWNSCNVWGPPEVEDVPDFLHAGSGSGVVAWNPVFAVFTWGTVGNTAGSEVTDGVVVALHVEVPDVHGPPPPWVEDEDLVLILHTLDDVFLDFGIKCISILPGSAFDGCCWNSSHL